MSAELDLRSSLAKNDIGEFRVPFSTVIDMSREHLDYAETFVNGVIRDNPEYEWLVTRDVMSYDTIIKWRKRNVNGTEKSSSDATVSGLYEDSQDV